jgi:hypothetical protein
MPESSAVAGPARADLIPVTDGVKATGPAPECLGGRGGVSGPDVLLMLVLVVTLVLLPGTGLLLDWEGLL